MPISDFICPDCETVHVNVYVPLRDFDTFAEICACGGKMGYDLRRKGRRSTRSHKFQEFVLHHTKRLDGTQEGREIRSLADIRAFERDHADSNVCVEAFSYDAARGNEEPVSQAEPVVMTEQQKRDFVEKFRAMDIKNERSARDYE